MLFATYHPETSSSQDPGKSNIWRLILNFIDFCVHTESTHTHTHTHTYTRTHTPMDSPKQAKQWQWRKKNSVTCLCVLIFSLEKYDSLRHFPHRCLQECLQSSVPQVALDLEVHAQVFLSAFGRWNATAPLSVSLAAGMCRIYFL